MLKSATGRKFVDVLEPGTRRLAFRIDPERLIIEIQRRGVKHLYDLKELGLCRATPSRQE